MTRSHIGSFLDLRIHYRGILESSTLVGANVGDPNFLDGEEKLLQSVFRVCLGVVICQERWNRSPASGSCDSVLGYSCKRQNET